MIIKLSIWLLLINVFNYFSSISPMLTINSSSAGSSESKPFEVEVQIQRIGRINPEYAFLYEKNDSENPAPRFKLELRRFGNWVDKREAFILMGANDSTDAEFDTFSFDEVPKAWIDRPEVTLGLQIKNRAERLKKFVQSMVELRIEMVATGEILFRALHLGENADTRHFVRKFMPMPTFKEIKIFRQPEPDSSAENINMAYLLYSIEQRKYCVGKLAEERGKLEAWLELSQRVRNGGHKPTLVEAQELDPFRAYRYAQIYRDLQWQIYNLQRLRLKAQRTWFDNWAVAESAKVDEVEKQFAMFEEEMEKHRKMLLDAQTEYIAARMETRYKPNLLLDMGKPVDEMADSLDKKLFTLENLIKIWNEAKAIKKQNLSKNVPQNSSAKQMAIQSAQIPQISGGGFQSLSGVRMLNFATNSFVDNPRTIDEFYFGHRESALAPPMIHYWPSQNFRGDEAAGPSNRSKKRKSPTEIAGSKKSSSGRKKSKAAHQGGDNGRDKTRSS